MTTDFTLKRIENCQPGDLLDMGVFDGIDPREPGQGPNTVNVRLRSGLHYTETAHAEVRVWRPAGLVSPPPTQSASFASRPEAEAWAAKLRADGMVRVRVAENKRGGLWVYWRAASR